MAGWWPYSFCFVRCCFQELFNIVGSILVQLPSSFFSIRLVSVHVVYPYSRIDTNAASMKLCFILSDRSEFHMIDNLSIAVYAFASLIKLSSEYRFVTAKTYIWGVPGVIDIVLGNEHSHLSLNLVEDVCISQS